jgi:hypothetical protein
MQEIFINCTGSQCLELVEPDTVGANKVPISDLKTELEECLADAMKAIKSKTNDLIMYLIIF